MHHLGIIEVDGYKIFPQPPEIEQDGMPIQLQYGQDSPYFIKELGDLFATINEYRAQVINENNRLFNRKLAQLFSEYVRTNNLDPTTEFSSLNEEVQADLSSRATEAIESDVIEVPPNTVLGSITQINFPLQPDELLTNQIEVVHRFITVMSTVDLGQIGRKPFIAEFFARYQSVVSHFSGMFAMSTIQLRKVTTGSYAYLIGDYQHDSVATQRPEFLKYIVFGKAFRYTKFGVTWATNMVGYVNRRWFLTPEYTIPNYNHRTAIVEFINQFELVNKDLVPMGKWYIDNT